MNRIDDKVGSGVGTTRLSLISRQKAADEKIRGEAFSSAKAVEQHRRREGDTGAVELRLVHQVRTAAPCLIDLRVTARIDHPQRAVADMRAMSFKYNEIVDQNGRIGFPVQVAPPKPDLSSRLARLPRLLKFRAVPSAFAGRFRK